MLSALPQTNRFPLIAFGPGGKPIPPQSSSLDDTPTAVSQPTQPQPRKRLVELHSRTTPRSFHVHTLEASVGLYCPDVCMVSAELVTVTLTLPCVATNHRGDVRPISNQFVSCCFKFAGARQSLTGFMTICGMGTLRDVWLFNGAKDFQNSNV